jgi:nitroreductase
MRVTDAVRARRSIRAFLPRPVPHATLREVLEEAARAPSGGNLQPWRLHVLTGDALERFRNVMRQRLTIPGSDALDYAIYPSPLGEPYRTQRFRCGEGLYAALGIERADKPARLAWFQNNYDFFGAPVGMFCFLDRQLGPPQWSDLGMYLQTVMLLLQERGIDSCAQECWSTYTTTVSRFLSTPPEHLLFCGMAIGYADPAAPANTFRTERAALDDFAHFHLT